MADQKTPRRILVIDGGGMRGLAPLLVIDAIMKELSTRNGRALLPCQVFDLICGTSVGGLISILIGRLGLDCQTAINIYETAVKKLFGEKGDAWKIIADGHLLDTSDFDAFFANIIAEYTGSPDVSMRLSLEDNQDLRSHPSTKTFITVMENAPSYTHIISSYKRQTLSTSANRHWTVPEVTRTTIASPIYISPQTFKTDKPRRFQDAGFGGYNNPVALASSEWKKIWPDERIELVLSLGTGLQDYLPSPLPKTREWHPKPHYVRKFCDEVFDRLPGVQTRDDIELNVAYAIRHLSRIAADSSLFHQQFDVKSKLLCGHYYRIDNPFGLKWFDLIDIFQANAVKTDVNDWLRTNREHIKDIAANLGVKSDPPVVKGVTESEVVEAVVESEPPVVNEVAECEPPVAEGAAECELPVVNEVVESEPPVVKEVVEIEPEPPVVNEVAESESPVIKEVAEIEPLVVKEVVKSEPAPPATMEIAQAMNPPPPPPGTVQGYNPVMDQPRPPTIEDYLRNYDVLFIVDDSGSMEGRRWNETQDALLEIAEYALKLNVRSVSLRFLNSTIYDQGVQGADRIKSNFDSITPIGQTPTGTVLKEVLNAHLDRIDNAASSTKEYSKIPPLDIIVLTDGEPSDNPASVIAQAVARLRKSKYHPNTMGIQFVQIGNEKAAKDALKKLVKGDNGSIVDTIPYKGVLTSAELQRIMLGGIHPNIRALVPVSWLARDIYVPTGPQ